MKPCLMSLARAVCVLLPSCVEWRIGDNIREMVQTRRFPDMTETEGGVVYSSHQPLPEDAEDWGVIAGSQLRNEKAYFASLPRRQRLLTRLNALAGFPSGCLNMRDKESQTQCADVCAYWLEQDENRRP